MRPASEDLTPVTAGATTTEPWRDPAVPVPERVADLLSRMTTAEKLAQLYSVWLSGPADGNGVAPLHGDFTTGLPPFADLIRSGLGQLTRVFGTRPLHPAEGVAELADLQAQIVAQSRFGIPAIAHEECLTGFATWTATIFPTPLAWGASFDPLLVRQMAAAIGGSLRAVGVHQGLAPVLDVARDPRWGRVEETIGADPYLVGMVGTAYVRGLESAGIIATLKHFAGYSGSGAGRNMAPVAIGRREFADVFLPPFEMAIREGGARSVMHSYAALDGVPPAADRRLLTGLLRDELGFDGFVVADYYGISFLEMLHGVAGTPAQAAGLALLAGVDMELPTVRCYGEPLAAAVSAGDVPEHLVDQAVARVLRQKVELGLLDHAGDGDTARNGVTGALAAGRVRTDAAAADIDLNPPEHRALARQLAEESVVLLANGAGTLPLPGTVRLAVVGPLAADPLAYFGCYTFPRHVGHAHPGTSIGVPVEPLLDALRRELPEASIEHAAGCDVRGSDRSGFAAAIERAAAADTVIAVLGDEAGLFGRGSSGEGCDASDLGLPGVQGELLDALAATGKPVVLVLITGRPYAIGPVAGQLAAVVQAFFPGQEGGGAIAGVLAGRVVPSGKLPIELPRLACTTQNAYRAPKLGTDSEVSSAGVTPLYPFGHGLSYTTFEFTDLSLCPAGSADAGTARISIGTDGMAEIACTVRNTGECVGTEVVQLYLADPVAQVVRPVRELAGFARVTLRPGQSRRVAFRLHADRTTFCGLSGERVVEAGLIEVDIGSSSADLRLHGEIELIGPERVVGVGRVLSTPVAVLDR
ncbi:MAG TPA: glycoside hydrolase family 3 N-terminal domain-containing protein [Streptosporangiaceae bacterium]|nr:glycoside hydrolase family 3 N-terminal domain-containing protein [Streptosporangiaceae bacterium]